LSWPWLLIRFDMPAAKPRMTNRIRAAREEQRKQQASQLASPSVPDDEDEDDR